MKRMAEKPASGDDFVKGGVKRIQNNQVEQEQKIVPKEKKNTSHCKDCIDIVCSALIRYIAILHVLCTLYVNALISSHHCSNGANNLES